LKSPPPPDKPFRMGLSVGVTIDISNTSGPLLSSTLQRRYQQQSQQNPQMAPESLQLPLLLPNGSQGGAVPDQPTLQP